MSPGVSPGVYTGRLRLTAISEGVSFRARGRSPTYYLKEIANESTEINWNDYKKDATPVKLNW